MSQIVVLKKFTCSARFALQKGIFKGKYAPQARKFWYLSVEKTDFKGEMCAACKKMGFLEYKFKLFSSSKRYNLNLKLFSR